MPLSVLARARSTDAALVDDARVAPPLGAERWGKRPPVSLETGVYRPPGL